MMMEQNIKKFCIDCGGLSYSQWCPNCFPKGSESWNRLRGSRYAHQIRRRRDLNGI